MKKSLRFALAAATGAAILVTGTAVTVAAPASAATSIAALTVDSTLNFLPPTGTDSIPFAVKVTDPYVGIEAPEIKAEFWKEGEATSGAGHAATVTQLADLANTTPAPNPPANPVEVTGAIPVSSSDKPTSATGKWTLKVTVDPYGAAAPVDVSTTFEVKPATRVTGVSISPDPVYLRYGQEADVVVNFTLEKYGDERITGVRLESTDAGDYYSLSTGLEADGKSYYDSTAFDYATAAGSWQLNVSVERGNKKYSFVKGFEVRKSSYKAKSKITLYAKPYKVKKGKTTKLYGKVYRGAKAWKKKVLKLYFKKKGTKKWKFVKYVKATSTGKYATYVKPKYDGYWRTTASATGYTYGSLSAARFIDVR